MNEPRQAIGSKKSPQEFPTLEAAIAAAVQDRVLVWAKVGGTVYKVRPGGQVSEHD